MRPYRDPFVKSLDIGIKPYNNPDILASVDYDKLESFIKSKPDNHIYTIRDLFSNYDNENPLICLGIEVMLKDIFSPHIHRSIIPQEFWGELRASERPFRDFLEVYKIWTILSKQVWSEYYKYRKESWPGFLDPQKIKLGTPKKNRSLVVIDTIEGSVRSWIEIPFNMIFRPSTPFYIAILNNTKSYLKNIRIIKFILKKMKPYKVQKKLKWIIKKCRCTYLKTNYKIWISQLFIRYWASYKHRRTLFLKSIVEIYNKYIIQLNRFVDLTVLAIILVALGMFYGSLDEDHFALSYDDNENKSFNKDMKEKEWLSTAAYIVIGTILVVGLYWFASDMYVSYQATLNYIDPAIRPLHLPIYAEIGEVIPTGLGRGDIINMYSESRISGTTLSESLLSPASPHQMYGFWE